MNITYINQLGQKVQRKEIENSSKFVITLKINGGGFAKSINGSLSCVEKEIDKLLKQYNKQVNEIIITACLQNDIIHIV